MPAFWPNCTTSSCQGTAHLYGVVEHQFPVVQSLGALCLPEVGSHRFSDLKRCVFKLMSIEFA